MLSEQEKREMLEDSRKLGRKNNFKFAKKKNIEAVSFDEYLSFLDSVQKIFSQLLPSQRKTVTEHNKL